MRFKIKGVINFGEEGGRPEQAWAGAARQGKARHCQEQIKRQQMQISKSSEKPVADANARVLR